MTFNKAEFFAIKDREVEKVTVPEWNRDIHLRVVTGAERVPLEAAVLGLAADDEKERSASFSRILQLVLADAEGNSLFSESEMEQVLSKNMRVLMRLLKAGIKLNAVREDDLEIAEKNLESSQD